MNRDLLRQIINVITFIMTVAANGLANALPLNGLTTAEISNSFPVLFTPANYVFGIWGLIYAGLSAFVIYQALPSQRENPRLRRVAYWFALGNIANTIWIFMWHYLVFPATELAMLTLLISLIIVYERLGIGRQPARGAARWFVNIPFSIYLGWISVATIANTSVLLYDLRWNQFGLAASVWTAIMLAVATLLTGLMIFRRGDAVYAGVIIWAFVGIVAKQSETQLVAATAALMTAMIVLFLLVYVFIDQKKNNGGHLSSKVSA